jgi:anti-sigma B factor antagonist
MVSIEVSTVEYDGHAVAALRGELDVTEAAGVAAALAAIVVRYPNLVIDLTGLEFIDCCGLRALNEAREQARRAGGDLLLAAPQRLVRRLLGLTGLADVFSVHASLELAGTAPAQCQPFSPAPQAGLTR